MDMIILVAAFVAFLALVVAWIAAPTGGTPAVVTESGTIGVGEARA